MSGSEPSAVVREVRTLFGLGALGALTDRQLLDRFADADGHIAAAAFGVLVERHGAMVWGVCRRILGDPHEAADAFQATFLVLVRRVGSVRVDDSLGRWLYGVSRRVAGRARRRALRRPTLAPVDIAMEPDHERVELLAVLDEEIGRLPEHYRAVVLLCDLGGLSHRDAARRLCCAEGTIGSRLARGREKLRARLTQRGFAPSAGVLAAILAGEANGSLVPPALVEGTVRAMTGSALGQAAVAAVVPAAISTLVEGAIKSMIISQWKWVAVAVTIAGVTAGGTFVHSTARSAAVESQPQSRGETAVKPSAPDARSEQPPMELLKRKHRDELDLLEIQRDRKKAELMKAQAQKELADAIVATNLRLNQQRPGMVSDLQIRKCHADARVADAMIEVATMEVKEADLRIRQLERMRDEPDLLREAFGRRSADAPALLPSAEAVKLQGLQKKADAAQAQAAFIARAQDALKAAEALTNHDSSRDPAQQKRSSAIAEAELKALATELEKSILPFNHAADAASQPTGIANPALRQGSSSALETRIDKLEHKLDEILNLLKTRPAHRPE